MKENHAIVFATKLGWCSLVIDTDSVVDVRFGRRTKQRATKEIGLPCISPTVARGLGRELAKRLEAFCDGEPDEFLDVPLKLDHLTPFARRVVDRCREIRFGTTETYGELASKAGSPRAARAVGTVMSKNRFPVIVPCHRVVAAAGSIGGYSAPDGLKMKRRLLALEGVLDELTES